MGGFLHPARTHAAACCHRALLLWPPELVAVCLEQRKCIYSGELAILLRLFLRCCYAWVVTGIVNV